VILQTSFSLGFVVPKTQECQYVNSREENIDLQSRQYRQPVSINLMLLYTLFHSSQLVLTLLDLMVFVGNEVRVFAKPGE